MAIRIRWKPEAASKGGTPVKLDGNSAVPLYEQMKIQLQEQIAAHIYAAGDRLPAEKELCEKYGVSRVTLRRAVDELVAEGILERKQGKGTFVAAKKCRVIFRKMNSIGGGFTDAVYPDTDKHTIVVSKKEYICNALEREKLGLSKDERVLVLLRLMTLDGQPFMIDRAVYPVNRFPGLFDRVKDDVSTYAILREDYGIHRLTSQRELGLAYATDEQAKLLGCSAGAPLFRIFKQVCDTEGNPVHLSNLFFSVDRIVFTDDGE